MRGMNRHTRARRVGISLSFDGAGGGGGGGGDRVGCDAMVDG